MAQTAATVEPVLEKARLTGRLIFLPRSKVFKALELCPFDRVKVVVRGLEPSHKDGESSGLAFSLLAGGASRSDASAKDILTELASDLAEVTS